MRSWVPVSIDEPACLIGGRHWKEHYMERELEAMVDETTIRSDWTRRHVVVQC